MGLLATYFPESRFGGFPTECPTTQFYTRVNALLRAEDVVLDIGCGRGVYGQDAIPFRRDLQILRGKCRRVVGIDVDPGASANPYIDEFRLIESEAWPVEDASVDLCVANYVLEHVEDPALFFQNCFRVLHPGGVACFLTSNLFSYFGLAVKLVPNRLHARVLKRVHKTSQRQEEDVFPTCHRCNTPWSLRRHLRKAGFDAVVMGSPAPPNYLQFSRAAYMLGTWYTRLAPRGTQVALVAFARKPQEAVNESEGQDPNMESP